MSASRKILMGTLMALLLLLTAGTAKAQFLFNGYNIYVVFNQPTKPTIFFVGGLGWQVTQVADYHFNFGLGVPTGTNVTITLTDFIRHINYGPFPAVAPAGTWDYIANVNTFLPTSWYWVQDSDPKTWSQNPASGSRGFTRVFGTAKGGHMRRMPAPPPPGVTGFMPCGNLWPAYRVEMSPCIGPTGSTITMMVVHAGLVVPLDIVVFKLALRRFGTPGIILPITAGVSGSGITPGSIYTVTVPSSLCAGGQYSVWNVQPIDKNGTSQGVLAQFTVTNCP
jgi:hypothetical protein